MIRGFGLLRLIYFTKCQGPRVILFIYLCNDTDLGKWKPIRFGQEYYGRRTSQTDQKHHGVRDLGNNLMVMFIFIS